MIIVLDDGENNGKELENDTFSVFVNFVLNVLYLLICLYNLIFNNCCV